MPTIADQAYEQYPRLRGYGFQFMDSRGDPNAGSRHLETYPADERDNPMPGRPTIQQFDPNATVDDFLGETLHILPKVDSQVGAIRDRFISSMTPQQHQRLLEQYEYHQKNYGEERPFEQWRDATGLDAWFRGRIAGQWPDQMYTPEQLQMFQQLKQYLQTPVGAHEKKPNQPVTVLPPVDPEEFADLDPDGDLFGTDDLIGLDLLKDDEQADR